MKDIDIISCLGAYVDRFKPRFQITLGSALLNITGAGNYIAY